MSAARLSWWESVRATGLFGGRASSLDLPALTDLLARGLRGDGRRRRAVDRLVGLLQELSTGMEEPEGPDPRDVRTALSLLTTLDVQFRPDLSTSVATLARAVADPAMLLRLGTALGDNGRELTELGDREADEPTVAAVDLEVRGGRLRECAVVLLRGSRRLCGRGVESDDVSWLKGWLEGAVLIAHNGEKLDFPELEKAGLDLPAARLDTLRLAWLADPEAPAHSLADLAEQFGVEVPEERHTALSDAEMLAALWPALRQRLSALPAGTRSGIRRALASSIAPTALDAAFGTGDNSRWTAPPLHTKERPPGPSGSDRHVIEGASLEELVTRSGSADTVAVPDLRSAWRALKGRAGLRLMGVELLDANVLSEHLDASGWGGALGIVLSETAHGAIALGPPSAAEELATLPRRSESILELGDGPMLTDRVTLAFRPPRGPLLVDQAAEVLLGSAPVVGRVTAPLPECLISIPEGSTRNVSELEADQRAVLAETSPLAACALDAGRAVAAAGPGQVLILMEPFDASAHAHPITAAGEDLGTRVPEIRRLWEHALGGEPPACAGKPRRSRARVRLVTGLPATSHATPAAIAGTGALAGALALESSTVLATSGVRRAAIAEAFELMGDCPRPDLLRPPEWPAYTEARRRLRERPQLALVAPARAHRLESQGVRLIVDRIGGANTDEPHIARMLHQAVERGDDPYGAVMEPLGALRLLDILAPWDGEVLVLDPVAQLPALRSALAGGGPASIELDGLLVNPAAQDTYEALARELLAAAPVVERPDPRPALPAALDRLLGDRKPQPIQQLLIERALNKLDTLAVLRTGWGKSLCYQAPALALGTATGETTIVISPLIALQRNQVDSLHNKDVWEATLINSELDPTVRAARLRGVRNGFYRLIYLAPEALFSPAIQRCLQGVEIGLIAVDEAHCISDMGHDFRPDYRTLGTGLARCLGLPAGVELREAGERRPAVLAVTGTANPAVRSDICDQFGGPMFTQVDPEGFIRPELRFDVVRLPDNGSNARDDEPDRLKLLVEILEPFTQPPRAIIVYADTRRATERIAAHLSTHLPVMCHHYHAGLETEQRRRVEHEFLHGRMAVIVATNAFGMGIDKEDVAVVVHWRLPATPEALYQEAGRAGRGLTRRANPPDEDRALCVALYREGDLDRELRKRRTGVPTRQHLRRTWEALRWLCEAQETLRPVVMDEDLAWLAGLPEQIEPRVVLAHLERVGLVRERERTSGVLSLRRLEPVGGSEAPLGAEEEVLLGLLSLPGKRVHLPINEVQRALDTADVSWTTRSLQTAVQNLERRGLVERLRAVVVRPALLDADGDRSPLDATRRVWKALNDDQEFSAGRSVGIRPDRLGVEREEARRAVEVMAQFGMVQVVPAVADGRLPRVRKGSRFSENALTTPAELIEGGLCGRALEAADSHGRLSLSEFAATEDLDQAAVLKTLTAAHLIGEIILDPQSWSAADGRGPVLARVLEVATARDGESALAEAASLAASRRRAEELKILALRRYAAIERSEQVSMGEPEADPFQRYLADYLERPGFLDELEASTRPTVLGADMNPQQRDAAAAENRRVVIIAGPGTGKTRTLTRRIAHRIRSGRVQAGGVMAVTFTRDAAQEMQLRLSQLDVHGVRVLTLNALGYRLIRDEFRALGFPAPPELSPQKTEVTERLRRHLDDHGISDVDARDMADQIAQAKRELLDPEALAQGRSALPGLDAGRIAAVWREYQDGLRRDGRVDFTDQVWLAAKLLRTGGGQGLRSTVEEVYVDEFQDLNLAQLEIVMQIAEDATLAVVGDPRQAIFEWNGARPGHLGLLFEKDSTASRHELVLNYRSSPRILSAANRLMADLEYAPVRAATASDGPPIRAQACRSSREVIDRVAALVRSLRASGVPNDQIAVLARRNDELSELARGLRALGQRVSQRDLEPLQRTRAFRLAERYLNRDVVDEAGSLSEGMTLLLSRDEVVTELSVGGETREEDERAEWARLTSELAIRDQQGIDDPSEALRDVARAEQGEDDRVEATDLILTSMHKAKGREWDAVIIARLNERALNHGDEERRVVYVALTRARRHLDVVWSGSAPALIEQAGIVADVSESRGTRRGGDD